MFWRNVIKWLRQPYPLYEKDRWNWRIAFFSGLFVTFFLFFLRPFGAQIEEDETWIWLRICAEYGLITVVVTLLWGYVERLFPRVFVEAGWKVWKEIAATLLFVSAIATANMLYSSWRYDRALSWRGFMFWQFATWSVGIFPTVLGVFLKQMKLMQRYSAEAADLSRHLDHHEHPERTPLVLSGENQGESLSILPDDLLYIAAADNYVQVFFLEDGQVKNRMLRGALRRFEDALAGQASFFRCHRTFLVNLDQVIRITGNAQGYKLHLHGVKAAVPVSRSLNDAIRVRIDALDTSAER